MKKNRDQKFKVSSIGELYRTSLLMFTHHVEDVGGNKIRLNDIAVGRSFFVIFKSGTGLTKTSAKRIA